jgi:hypothetical protein
MTGDSAVSREDWKHPGLPDQLPDDVQPVPEMMQFRMVSRNGEPMAMSCPFFMCAACGHPVYSVKTPLWGWRTGYVIWWTHYVREDPDDWTSPVIRREQLGPYVVHQGVCDKYLCQRTAELGDPRWGEHASLSLPLSDVLSQLVYNTEHPLGSDGRKDPEFPDNAEYIAPWPSKWRAGNYQR